MEDFDKIKNYCWHTEEKGYIATDTHSKDKGTIKMHRLVMGVSLSHKHVDHINHKTNDNRKCNLRICTASENNWNVEKRIDNKSGCPGVSWHKRDLCWEVHIQVHKNNYILVDLIIIMTPSWPENKQKKSILVIIRLTIVRR